MYLRGEIINWLKKYSSDNSNLCFIIGISGGVDSAVVSTLCSETGIETHVVSLPIYQNKTQLILANKHIEWLKKRYKNVSSHEIDLSESFKVIKNNLSEFDSDLGFANSRSRLRMMALYQISTFFNGLVVGTGNKIEDFGVGFFTKYGDGGVDISPIADLTKTEVRLLGKELGIIEGILIAKPTDGLWEDDRNDEDQIGATYEELEWAMDYYEKNKIIHTQDLNQRQLMVLSIYKKFNDKNNHKMRPIPIFKK
jgi:NAD+ synthase